jgi:hypothetical protein
VKFWLGLAIGVAVGSAGMYLGMTRPWSRPEPVATVEAAVDAGVAPAPGKRKRRRGGGGGGGGGAESGDLEGGDELAPAVVLTEADRRMEWRGDDVALPSVKMDMAGGGAEGRPLDGREIQSTFAADGQAVLDCIVKATGAAELKATVTVKLLVEPSGRPVKSRVHAPAYLFGNGLLACAKRAIGGLRFPATGAHTVVTQPFDLY